MSFKCLYPRYARIAIVLLLLRNYYDLSFSLALFFRPNQATDVCVNAHANRYIINQRAREKTCKRKREKAPSDGEERRWTRREYQLRERK